MSDKLSKEDRERWMESERDRLSEAQYESELAGPTGLAIPRALFSCSNESCAAENSYHADQLFWYANTQRWVCENCWYYLPYHHPRGITLEDYIIKGGFSAALLVLNKRKSDTAV